MVDIENEKYAILFGIIKNKLMYSHWVFYDGEWNMLPNAFNEVVRCGE